MVLVASGGLAGAVSRSPNVTTKAQRDAMGDMMKESQ